MNGREERCIQGSIGEVGEKRSLGKHKLRLEENIENEPSRNRIGFWTGLTCLWIRTCGRLL